MPALDEDAIRAAIDAGVRAALASLHEPDDVIQVADEYPDYDEHNFEPVIESQYDQDAANQEAQDVVVGPSPLRQAARGQGSIVVDYTEDGDEILPEPGGMRGEVVPITASESIRGAGFDPRSNGEWFARQRQRDMALRRQPAWETVVRKAN